MGPMESTATTADSASTPAYAGPPIGDRALEALRAVVGAGAEFRAGQLEAITALVAEHRRVLCVQRTGWGKSAVYFVATKLLREEGAGPTLLVSPLLALMRNQIDQADRGGVRAATINSDNTDDWQAIAERLARDDLDILLVSPERFANPRFRAEVLPQLVRTVGLFVIDEAHCISDWGHDFRPDYRRLARVIDELPPGVPVLCTTATANDRVVDDVVAQLAAHLFVLRGPLEREALALDVVHLPNQAQRLAWLTDALGRLPGAGIVYTLTVRDCRLVAEWLQQHGIAAAAYFGGEMSDAKQEIEARLQANDLKAVVATSALGMGYDKADLAFVVHYQSPGSAIAYYQQVGRAGRGIDRAVGVLLTGTEDTQIQDWFIDTAFPRQADAEALMALLDASEEPVGLAAIEQHVNLGRTRLTNMLKQLEVDGAIERAGAKYRRTGEPWVYPAERVEQVTRQRRAEQARMHDYLHGDGCLMEHLRRELDDRAAAPCGRCSRCLGRPLVDVGDTTELAREAVRFLRDTDIEIEPRKQWPDLKRIPAERRAEPGRGLAIAGDGGWGRVIADQREAGHFADELVAALASLLRAWRPFPRPAWLTAVPSPRRPELVADLGRRLAVALALEYRPVVAAIREHPPQAEQRNSAQQFRNVDGAFAITGTVLAKPVLLVDDVVDSRWTLTVVAGLLRDAGTGPVFPVCLARAGGG